MRVKVSALASVVGLLALLPAVAVPADEAAGPQLMIVEYATIDPADAEEFEAWFKDWVTAFQGSGLGADFNWFTSSGPGPHYLWVSPIGSYSVLAQSEERMKQMGEAIGEEELGQLFSKMNLMKSHRRELLHIRPDLSYAGPADAGLQPGFIRIFVHHVRPGLEERYEAVIKRMAETFTEARQPHGWDAYSVEFGEGSYVYTSIARTAAAYHERPTPMEVLTKALGEAEAGKVLADWRECVRDFNARDAMVRPELSFVAAPAAE